MVGAKKTLFILICTVVCLGMVSANPAHVVLAGQNHLTEIITPHGTADWTSGVIQATGIGFPPKDAVGTPQAQPMAKRAAHSVALRNLLEAIRGVRVESTTTVQNLMVASDVILVKIEGIIEGARIVEEHQNSDGSYQETLELKLGGDISGLLLPQTSAKEPKKLPPSPKESGPKESSSKKTPDKVKTDNYTGLVVDARGTGAKPAVAPKILTEDGEEAYSYKYAAKAVNKEPVAYVRDLSAASAHPRVTDRPLIIKAVRAADGGTDLVIRRVDAQILHGVPQHFEFLEKAHVIVVLDTTDPRP